MTLLTTPKSMSRAALCCGVGVGSRKINILAAKDDGMLR